MGRMGQARPLLIAHSQGIVVTAVVANGSARRRGLTSWGIYRLE